MYEVMSRRLIYHASVCSHIIGTYRRVLWNLGQTRHIVSISVNKIWQMTLAYDGEETTTYTTTLSAPIGTRDTTMTATTVDPFFSS